MTFREPLYLWLLVAPVALLMLWVWQVLRRRADERRLVRERVIPVMERRPRFGDLAFWGAVGLAAICCILALARPVGRISLLQRGSADIVVLQDGSASMHVTDVAPDRWRRSVQFLRVFAETLDWRGDRVALALFAFHAAPQVRLTKDPNALFFFIDHLGSQPPFSLEDDATWDTNIEEGVSWGLKLVDVDKELFGGNKNPKAFVLISDGQAWSGTVARAVATARARDIRLYVVGVGTATGGVIPDPWKRPPLRAALDRESLMQIARTGGGQYFELGRESDRTIASKIITNLRRRVPVAQEEESAEELYWRFLFAAAVLLCCGALVITSRLELSWLAAGVLISVVIIASTIR